VEVTLLGGKRLRKVSLLAALQAHEVVHFAGHSHHNPQQPHRSGWRLHDDVLTASELSRLTRPPFLVFSNSCQAGATTAWADSARYDQQAFGIGSAFLLAGVQNYIGTFWVIHDEESVLFATTFYQKIATGFSLGAALLLARQEIIAQRGWQGLTWASHMLYGDPTFTLLPSAETPRAAPTPAAVREHRSTDVSVAENGPRDALRRYEREQCERLDLLGRLAPLETHYQALPLLREVKRERLPRKSSERGARQSSEEQGAGHSHGLHEVDILRWEEELREEHVLYTHVSLPEVFQQFRSVVKEAKSDTPRFVVLGPPGSGKTTFMQYLGWQTAAGALQVAEHSLLPVRVRLSEWEAWTTQARAADQRLPNYLAYHYAHLSPSPDATLWDRWLQHGEALLLLDGLDEIEGRPTFLANVKMALDSYAACPTILACRTVSFEQHRRFCADLPLFTLSSLAQAQQDAYVRAFPAAPQGASAPDALIAHLTRTPSLRPLAASPLLLGIICYVAEDSVPEGGLPTTRGSLYQRAVKKLLTYRSQRVEARYPGAEPTVDEKLAILEHTALHLFARRQQRLAFSGQELGQALRQALETEGYGEASAPWANALRVDLSLNSGVIRGNDAQGFFFLHLTVQEFLTASALAKHINAQGWETRLALADTMVSPRRLIDGKAWDPSWQEVILLLAGQLTDPLPLFHLLTRERYDDLFRHRLALAALCLPEAQAILRDRHTDLVDALTTAAFSLWRRYQRQDTAAAVAHLTRALPALGRGQGRLDGIPLLQALCRQGRDRQVGVRVSAIAALGRIGEGVADKSDSEALSLLLDALHDQELQVRIEALEALRRISAAAGQHPALRPTLLYLALRDQDGLIRSGAARTLEHIWRTTATENNAHPELDAALLDSNPHVSVRAQQLRQKLIDIAQPDMNARLAHNETARGGAAVAATSPTPATDVHAGNFLPLVKSVLHESDPSARAEALRVLEHGDIDLARYPDPTPLLLQTLEAEDGGVRARAAKLLKLLGPALVHQVQALSTLESMALHDRSSGVRVEAVETLGWMEEAVTEYPGVMITLVHALQHDRDETVRARAAGALGRLGKVVMQRPETVSTLVSALRDNDEEVRFRAAEALERIMAQGVRVFRRWWKKIEGKTLEELARL
jgi:HEAT repeat protein